MQATNIRSCHTVSKYAVLAASVLALAGCDMLGIETPAQTAAKKEAEGRAIGSACRHAVRSIEDCYRNNPKAAKAAVFDGWKEMDAYMRENSIEGMPFAPAVTGPDESLVPAEGHEAPKKDKADEATGDKKPEH
ncbi:MAG TPA: hypothetical protein VFY31_02725 [Macromonas sp.]|nr:hypothetical protein [Macromonas sp.]